MIPSKHPGTITNQLKYFSNRSKMPRSMSFVEILDMTWFIWSCMHWIISLIYRCLSRWTNDFYCQNTDWPTFQHSGPLFEKYNITDALQEKQHMPTFQQTMTPSLHSPPCYKSCSSTCIRQCCHYPTIQQYTAKKFGV